MTSQTKREIVGVFGLTAIIAIWVLGAMDVYLFFLRSPMRELNVPFLVAIPPATLAILWIIRILTRRFK